MSPKNNGRHRKLQSQTMILHARGGSVGRKGARNSAVPKGPAALSAGHSLDTFIILGRVVSPSLPRMVHQRIFSIRPEKFHQLFSFCRAETRTDSDVLQSAGIVEQTE